MQKEINIWTPDLDGSTWQETIISENAAFPSEAITIDANNLLIQVNESNLNTADMLSYVGAYSIEITACDRTGSLCLSDDPYII